MLRFKLDINTTDENEDYSIAAAGWDYRYGQTSYGFMNVSTQDIDATDFEGIAQTRPNWMADEYFTDVADFTTRGLINVEVDAAKALELLNPFRAENPNGTGYLTNDTTFTVVTNDGHSGVATEQYKVTINYQPEILTETLPNAVQGAEYNKFLNENAKIEIPTEPSDVDDIDVDLHDDSSEEEDENFNIAGEEFISETLAGIYFAQKNYKAAQNIYVKLIELEPEKKEYYQSKIQEIDDILNRE